MDFKKGFERFEELSKELDDLKYQLEFQVVGNFFLLKGELVYITKKEGTTMTHRHFNPVNGEFKDETDGIKYVMSNIEPLDEHETKEEIARVWKERLEVESTKFKEGFCI